MATIQGSHILSQCDISDTESYHSAIEYQRRKRKNSSSKPRDEQGWLRAMKPQSITEESIPRRTSSISTTMRRRGNRQDLVAFHRKSCRLFSSLDGTLQNHNQSLPQLPEFLPSPPPLAPPRRHSNFETFVVSKSSPPRTVTPANSSRSPAQSHHRPSLSNSAPESECTENSQSQSHTPRPLIPTALSWMSVETRRREYEKIDRANSGVRGLWKALVPTCWHSRSWRKDFFRGECDGSSVRRLRVKMPDEKEGGGAKKAGANWRCLPL